MSERIIIAIDTSNYTTSVSLMRLDGKLIANIKRPLPVKQGECGLRQSDAVFAHIKNLPSAMREARERLDGRVPVAVGVSTRPRNVDGSYMPCFLAGVSAAESISATLGIPLYSFSHQCGHIMAALYSSEKQDIMDSDFAAFHISGGTTELLRVRWDNGGFVTELLGGTRDLNAGQVIDRVGVHLGMPFPAGPHLESAALKFNGKIHKKKVSLDGAYMNLSGLENLAKTIYNETQDTSASAAFVFDYIGNAILGVCNNFMEVHGNMPFVFAGGVMCNSIIKNKLAAIPKAYFATPDMSADNAVGVAALTVKSFLNEE